MAPEDVVGEVERLGPGAEVVVLAGPGVVAAGPTGIEGLRALAERGGLGVVNTWGAKGLFDWQSPHHLGTAGLQERDFELAGLGDADLIIASGLDTKEAPPERWRLAPHRWVRPRELGRLAEVWPHPPRTPRRPPLYTRLAEVVQPLYASDAVPLSPARAIADLKAVLPPGSVVFADPGLAGFWVARAFPTSELGSVIVPAVEEGGFAAWNAVNAAGQGRTAVAVTTSPYDLDTDEAVAYAATAGVSILLCAWGRSGSLSSADAHARLLREALATERLSIVEVPVDWSDTDLLTEVAGEIVAWG